MYNYLFEVERNSINNFELDARYDARKSFYGKAKVYAMKDGTFVLVSYSTPVAEAKDGVVTIYGKWSQSTTRHQNEFKKQFSA